MTAQPVGRFIYRLYRRLERLRPELHYLFAEITRRCNLSCRHCGSDCSAASQGRELSTDSWLKIIDYFKARFQPPPAVVITGGEPLLSPGLETIAAHLGENGFTWGLVSNGFIYDPARWQALLDRRLASATISLDGDAAGHNGLRRHPKAYDHALKTLGFLAKAGLSQLDVVSCVYPGNLDTLDNLAETLHGLGVPAWRLFRIFPIGRAARDPALLLDAAGSWRLVDWIRDRRPRWLERGLDLQLCCEGYLPFAIDRQVRAQPFFCRAGINIASILCNGDITGCSNNHRDFAQGNILRDDFLTVWRQRFQDFRRRPWLRGSDCQGNARQRRCPHWDDCQGSSIHLWTKSQARPAFCYLDDQPGRA
ncbi:MAG: hypothetical protein A2087_09375 [Spirochaetes bacterium GWD1_61_31]|nr:MAG: hypothetical protein A2Y37_13920 [Spirochaetes bacterium GWB1_60_80]OHD40290.1 MAG: hypothetical protein A2087_09375 [Spirochaetes bacterium GWD1_61_31]OHD44839.1 MAG: hypothetical protein A2Y35_00485 [Spirochaetes bacterium GWE1_60_18]OHD59953.1 MAG: hypothetical protein A2Y32_04740 [Spirochaetes bacterium GWF1_60_12]